MQNNNLQKKRALRTALLILLLSVAGMGKGYAQYHYDFSAVCPTGQTLYYNFIDTQNHFVELTFPINTSIFDEPWAGFTKPTGNIILPEVVRYFGIDYTVTRIGDNALYECSDLIGDLIIPQSVISISGFAFAGCSGFTGSLTIPNSVTTIGDWAFSGCGGFTGSLTIGTAVTSIGTSAFKNCGFTQVNYNAINCADFIYNSNWGDPPFYGIIGSLTIGENVERIPGGFCYGATFSGELTIPNSVTSIGDGAFYGCTGFTGSLTIPNSVTLIGYRSFSGCNGLTGGLTISDSVTKIGAYAFEGCNGFTSITIPNSVTLIGERAFYKCTRLAIVYYNAKNAQGHSVFEDCASLTTIHIGSDVEEIGSVFRTMGDHPAISCSGFDVEEIGSVVKGTLTVHLVVALGPTPAVLVDGAFSDFANNSILMVSCGKRLTYYSVWNTFEYNNIIEDCGQYPIGMNNIGAGGSVTASTTNAQMGEEVQLTVSPNAGMILSSISVCNATDLTQSIPVYPIGKVNSIYGFIMPPFGVSVTASFTAGNSVGENNIVMASIYPNPTSGSVNIKVEDLRSISIFNVLGQIVYESKACGNEFVYDFSKHKAGMYLIRIETEKGVVVKKVSVTR